MSPKKITLLDDLIYSIVKLLIEQMMLSKKLLFTVTQHDKIVFNFITTLPEYS